MNICLLTLEWPPYGGGIGTYMYNLASGLAELGHSVVVITHNKAPEQLKGVKIFQAALPHNPGSIRRKLFQWRWEPHYTWSERAWKIYNDLEKEYFFDIIETAEYGAWARHFIGNIKTPIAVRCHTPAHGVREISSNGQIKCKLPLWLSIENSREQRQTMLADAISTPSCVLSCHISMSWSMPFSRITVFPNPVDTKLFHPPYKTESGVSERKKEILYVGRLQYNKGIFDLIEAVKPLLEEHADLTVRFIGQDMKTPNHISNKCHMASQELLSRVPSTNRHQIIITGWVSLAELISYQQKAMVAVVPSRGFESFSYTVAQNMACGTTVVASQCGGPAEIISHGEDGLLVPPGDIGSLTSALRQLIENKSLCEKLGRNAGKKVEELFSIPIVVPRIANWYQKIVSRYKDEKNHMFPIGQINE